MHDTQVKAIKINAKDVQDYIRKGPSHHGQQLAEFIGDIQQLVQAMSVLMGASPITMMIGKVEVECIVRAHGGGILTCDNGWKTSNRGGM